MGILQEYRFYLILAVIGLGGIITLFFFLLGRNEEITFETKLTERFTMLEGANNKTIRSVFTQDGINLLGTVSNELYGKKLDRNAGEIEFIDDFTPGSFQISSFPTEAEVGYYLVTTDSFEDGTTESDSIMLDNLDPTKNNQRGFKVMRNGASIYVYDSEETAKEIINNNLIKGTLIEVSDGTDTRNSGILIGLNNESATSLLTSNTTSTTPVDNYNPEPALQVLENCFETEDYLDGYRITNYKGKNPSEFTFEDPKNYDPSCDVEDLVIPSTIAGKNVLAIAGIDPFAFGSFKGRLFNSVYLPNTLVEIGDYAFEENKFTSLVLPNSLTTIGSDTFGQNQISSIDWGTGLTTVGTQAFAWNKLTTVSLPESIINYGQYLFSFNDITSYTLPANMTEIPFGLFINNKLESITLPNHITSIGQVAFARNRITEVNIPSHITNIWISAFEYNQITNITLPLSMTSLPGGIFNGNNMTNIVIPSHITSIGQSAFKSNSATSITIPSSVSSIWDFAFYTSSGPAIDVYYPTGNENLFDGNVFGTKGSAYENSVTFHAQ